MPGAWRSWPGWGRRSPRRSTPCWTMARFPRPTSSGPSSRPGSSRSPGCPGLGPKRVRQLHEHLGVTSVEELRAAVEAGRLADVPGFGPKAQENVLAGLAADDAGATSTRYILSKALEVGDAIVEGLRPFAKRGGAGRQRPPDGRLVQGPRRGGRHRRSARLSCGPSKPCPRSTWCTRSGEAGRPRRDPQGAAGGPAHGAGGGFGNLLQHFTGSGKHNEALRTEAVRRGPARERIRDRRRRRRQDRRPARPRRRSTSCWACSTSRRSCARTGASSSRRAQGGAARADRAGRHPRRPAHAHRRLGRQEHHRGDGGAPPASAATGTWPSPTTRPRTASATTCRPTSCCARSSACGCGCEVDGLTAPGGQRGERAHRRLAGLRGRPAGAARLGRGERAHLVPHGRGGDDRADGGRDGAPAGGRDRPSHRAADRRAASPTRVDLDAGDRGGGRAPAPSSRSTPTPTGATCPTSTPARRPRPG